MYIYGPDGGSFVGVVGGGVIIEVFLFTCVLAWSTGYV